MNSQKEVRFAPILVSAIVGTGCIYLIRRKRKSLSRLKPSVTNIDTKAAMSSASYPAAYSITEILTLIQNRRSIFPKQYTGETVPTETIHDMLEAARWAPTHNLTEPWSFIIFESKQSRKELGLFMAEQYKKETPQDKFLQAKYDKKISSVDVSSHVIAICVNISSETGKRNPLMEELCSVAMAVQNMHLVATAHGVGAYWSTGGIYHKGESTNNDIIKNPPDLKEYLNLGDRICIGWFYVGQYFDSVDDGKRLKSWPTGRRKHLDESSRVLWK